MPFKDKEKEKEYRKKYREQNKEKIKQYKKKYREKNKEKIKEMPYKDKEKKKEYQKKYMEKKKEKRKIYNQSKERRKTKWKSRGLNLHNFDYVWKMYSETTNCDICDRILTECKPRTETSKCMDHDHETGEFRAILCISCNVRRK